MRLVRSIFGRPWLVVVLIVGCIGGAVLAAFAGWSVLRDRGGDGTVSTPVVVNSGGGGGGGVGIPAGSFGVDSSGRLVFSLSRGQAGEDAYELLPVAVGTPLSPEEIQLILDRLPQPTEAAGDRVDFNLPDEILPPPQPGETVDQPFGEVPEVATPEVPDGPLEVLRFSPEGEIPLAPFLSVTFNQPMVPLATVEELAAADVPVRISPEIPGVWRWLGTKTLTFEYAGGEADRFPMATEYVAEIPAGTQSAVGTTLAETITWRFSTPPPQMINFYPGGGPQILDPIFFIAFDQLIDPQAVLSSIRVTADGDTVSVQLATADEITADERVNGLVEDAAEGRWLAFRAANSLPPAADINVTIGPGTPSAEGPLVTTEAQSFRFETYDELEIIEHYCGWYNGGECPPLTPFWIQFNNPIDAAEFEAGMVQIEPELVGASVTVQGNQLEIRGLTKGRTTYRVTVDGSIQDIFGQRLGDDETLTFRVGSAPNALSGPDQYLITLDPSADTPVFTVYTINYSRLEVKVYAVEPDDWRDYQSYRENFWRQDNPPTPPGELVMNETIGIENVADELTEVPINLSEALDGETGHLIVVVQPPSSLFNSERNRNPVQAWVQVTQIGLDAFVDHSQLVAWATDLKDGSPLSGVDVQLLPGGGTAATGSDGLARMNLGSGGSYLLARQGDDTAILPSNPYYWDDTAWITRPPENELRWFVLDDRQMYRPGEEVHVKGWLRIIGGGQTGDVELPGTGLEQVSYSVIDPQGNELLSGQSDVNALGGFDLAFTLPENSNLGYASLRLTMQGSVDASYSREYYHNFQIQEFRRPEFEVTARTETSGPYFVGDQAVVAASANYFAGGALPNAETQWYVCSEPGSYSPPNWPGFTFGTWTPWWYFGDFYYYQESFYRAPFGGEYVDPCQSFSGTTDASGENFLQINIESADAPKPFNLRAEATVFDVNRQAWAASTSLLVHPASLYVGMRGETTFVEQGEPIDIDVIATDIDGNAVSGRSVTVQAARLDWQYREGSWIQEEVDTQTCTITSASEPVSCTFETAVGGEYEIKATVTDEQGRLNQSTLTRWVSGGERPPTRNVEQEQLTLIPDKELYAPGDTAEILVQAPFTPAEGLLTVSRSGILYTERFQIAEGSQVLRIPIEEAHLPNLQVQVDLVGSAPRTNDAGEPLPNVPDRPAFATGNLTLNISTQSRSLTVEVVPQVANLEPGAETAVEVAITDANGSPVANAEVALFVVDESVLALSGYHLQDPLNLFYSMRDGFYQSVYGRSSIVLANPESLADSIETVTEEGGRVVSDAVEQSEALATGTGVMEVPPAPAAAAPEEEADMDGYYNSGADEAANQATTPITVRTNFNPLAVFAPAVVTDSDGRAVVSLTLPDNLTRYRIMAVAVGGGKQFGTGESNLTARLPLMVRPSAPRFLNFGDQFELPIVLQNQTDEDLVVEVVVQATNIQWIASEADVDSGGQRVTVPANDRIEVRFSATTDSVGTARFQIAAVSGPYADAATAELPVYTPATTEAFATYGVLDGVGAQTVAIAQPILSPTGVFPQFGGLEIQTSSTALQALTDAVLYLSSYPYECSEQLASRILAVAALRDVLTAFEAEGLPEPAELEAAVARDIERLQGMQNNDGGWPVWQRGYDSIPFYTIHVVHALVRAQENDFAVPDAALRNGLNYLGNIESHYPNWYSREIRQTLSAYAVYVRYLAGDTDAAKAARLLDEAGLEEMSLEALGWLWPVLNSSGQYSSEVEAIGDHLNNRVVETAAAANFTTSYGDQEYLMLHSNRRTDGIILDALITVQPESDLIPKVVNGLLANQTRGRWNNTQENVFILLALDHYFNTFEDVTPDFVARLWLGDTYIAEHAYEGRTTERIETVVPMSYLVETAETQNLIIGQEGQGRLYYRLGLQYAPDDLELEALDMGFAVQRVYEAVDDPDDVFQDENGVWHIRAGARVRVKVTMATSNRRYNVALVDPLPAGLEIINPALAVSGSVPQNPDDSNNRYGWWWWGTWYEHQNMRDERAEAFTTLLWDGVYTYSYVTRATTPGVFVVPPAKAEEMYSPEVFGRSSSDVVVVE